jgi:DNA-binding NtrC family response regulator
MDLSKIHILVLDRDVSSAQGICRNLMKLGYQVSFAPNENDAFLLTEEKLFNVVLKGFDADRVDAVAMMEKFRALAPDTQFIFMGAGGTIHTAVEAIRRGAYDYLIKPVDPNQLAESVKKALEHQALVADDQRLKIRLKRRSEPNVFAGNSALMQNINRLIDEVAPTDVSVLIQGESGTGKEIVARGIHERSRRRNNAFIAVNCAALPDSIIETEFFGHVRGAFTGAISDRLGRFQLAQGGTLFLDEIGDLSTKGQGDLLRVLDDGNFRPIGSPKFVRANVRIIAATNKNLEVLSAKGGFRDDLYYRLNIVLIRLPPLRERVEDIPPLMESFAKHFCAKHRRKLKNFSKEVIQHFQRLPWPGNVRQLRNIIERFVVTTPERTITMNSLPDNLLRTERKDDSTFTIKKRMTLAQVEAEMIRDTLARVTSNRIEASRILGISRRTLQYKIRQYGLNRRKEKTGK